MNSLKLQIISCLILIFSMIACGPIKLIPTEEYIRIGHGGGFAGIETVYTLFTNGQVEQAGAVIGRLNNKEIEQIKKNIRLLNLDNTDYNKPGNLYKFIEFQLERKIHKIAWDSNDPHAETEFNLFYDHVYHLIKNSMK